MNIAGVKINTGRIAIYLMVIAITIIMLLPFAWMLSASLKLNREVFQFPIHWIPPHPRWQNYIDIWTKIPLTTFIYNTAKITIIVTLLQLLTSSFAAYAFAKLNFRYRDWLFLGYIATIAMPWQVYMVPQFLLMREMGLYNTHLAIICLQAFTAFGVFLMRQFYMSIPDELCEAARVDGMSEYRIWWNIMLPLSKPALSTLTIFTFVFAWNDFLGPMIYLTKR
jgi:multiple sugar transport system permease protein